MSKTEQAASAKPARPTPTTWHLRVAYNGAAYRGWQIQTNAPSVQAALLARVRTLFRDDKLQIYGSSRTDAGVHALDQNVSFRTRTPACFSADKLRVILNRILPGDVRVVQARIAEPDFHARHCAWSKAYVYCLNIGSLSNPFEAHTCWHYPRKLNQDHMAEAAALLTGEHDFASFAVNPKREVESTVRCLYRVELIPDGQRLYIHILGNSFLYKMVRSLVGYLVEVGLESTWRPSHTRAVLDACARSAAGVTAPPQGLFLARVFYEADDWRAYQPPLPPTSFL